jgi:hypothetical protein
VGSPDGVTMTVNINGNNPTGTVTFREGGNVLGIAVVTNGSASLTLAPRPIGQYTITAEYSGDAENVGSMTYFEVSITPKLDWLAPILMLLLSD